MPTLNICSSECIHLQKFYNAEYKTTICYCSKHGCVLQQKCDCPIALNKGTECLPEDTVSKTFKEDYEINRTTCHVCSAGCPYLRESYDWWNGVVFRCAKTRDTLRQKRDYPVAVKRGEDCKPEHLISKTFVERGSIYPPDY